MSSIETQVAQLNENSQFNFCDHLANKGAEFTMGSESEATNVH